MKGEIKSTRVKPLRVEYRTNKINWRDSIEARLEPRPHWQKGSAVTTGLTLLLFHHRFLHQG